MTSHSRLLTIAATLLLFIPGGCGNDYLEPLPAVAPLFAGHGANWNAYIKGDTWDTASDTACVAASDTACVHGAEHHVASVPELSDCSGLSAADALGAFDWVCDDTDGEVRFISTGLKDGVFLSDLIDFVAPGWRNNFVTVKQDGDGYGVTPAARWWSNPVVIDNDGGTLATLGTVYLVTSETTANYTLEPATALVAKPGVTIHGVNEGDGADWSVVTSTSPYVWIEGTIDATGVDQGVRLYGNQGFAVLRNVTATGASLGAWQAGIYIMHPSVGNRLEHIDASNNGRLGVYLSGSSHNLLSDVVASANGETGIDVQATDNRFIDLTVTDNLGTGLSLIGADHSWISGVLSATGNSSGDCYVEGGVDPGLDDDLNPSDVSTDIVHDGLCVPQGASDFTLP